MPYFYEGHMGGIYAEKYELSHEQRYCKGCGGSEELIGFAMTKSEAEKLLRPYKVHYTREHIREAIDEAFRFSPADIDRDDDKAEQGYYYSVTGGSYWNE